MNDATVARLKQVLDEPELEGTRYRLLRQIGRGGMGTVWEAVDSSLDRNVALKVLPIWGLNSERLQMEARILARLEHPGIVPIHDAGVLPDGRAFYAMKLVQGRRLDHAREGASRTELLRLFQRLCEPVAFAHSRGVIHRDLKPENIMVGEFGEVLVMDWGIARVGEAAGEHGVIGTPGCMSPEQAAGENDRVDARSDVYGLGGILQFLLSAQEVPKPLAAICSKSLAPQPADRYAGAADLAADIGRYLEGEPVTAYRENFLETTARWTARNQTLVLLVLAYLVMRALMLLFIGR